MTKFVLKEAVASKRLGKPIYFKSMTGIGPCTTGNIDEAATFDSHMEAIASPAMHHVWSYFETEELP